VRWSGHSHPLAARGSLALLAAVTALAASPPIAAPDPGGNGKANGKAAAPGQAKLAVVTPAPAPAPARAPAAQAKGKNHPKARAAAATKAAPAAAPAPAPEPAPAPVAAPTPQPAPLTPSPSRAQPRAQPAPAQTRARAPARPAATGVPAIATRPTVAPKTTTGRSHPAPRSTRPKATAARPHAGSPLTQRVVQVLEVIPRRVLIALAALAAVGLVLAAAAVAQTRRARRLSRQSRRLAADVGVLQSALLPDLPRRIGGARVSAAYRPAEGLAAGGDFYDAFELPGGRTAVLVGDVAGHGRDVVPITALVRYSVRAYLEAGLAPRTALRIASHVLDAQLGGRMVTVAVATFDPATGRLTFACAGHWPPLLLGIAARPVTVSSSPPIGAGVPTGRRQTTVALPPGAVACFHTDGLADVTRGPARLGPDGVAKELEALGAQGEARDLLARIVRGSDHQPDDMAACMLAPLPGPAEDRWLHVEELEVDAAMVSDGRTRRFLVACGVPEPRIEQALGEARVVVARAGSAVIEVELGEALAQVCVGAAAAVTLPATGDPRAPDVTAATG
jgi:serine phosphatase RsbU (regulator of sigma subunit)